MTTLRDRIIHAALRRISCHHENRRHRAERLLRSANLNGANLRGANLRHADLHGADLRGASLHGADLYSANLRGANLRGAFLDGAILSGAHLSGAHLSGADLGDCVGVQWVACGWSDHGECGRMLLAVRHEGRWEFQCGCFHGDATELRQYINNGLDELRRSRTAAMEFCLARIAEMEGDAE